MKVCEDGPYNEANPNFLTNSRDTRSKLSCWMNYFPISLRIMIGIQNFFLVLHPIIVPWCNWQHV